MTLSCLLIKYFPDGYCFQQDNDPKHKSKGINYAVRSSIVVSHVPVVTATAMGAAKIRHK